MASRTSTREEVLSVSDPRENRCSRRLDPFFQPRPESASGTVPSPRDCNPGIAAVPHSPGESPSDSPSRGQIRRSFLPTPTSPHAPERPLPLSIAPLPHDADGPFHCNWTRTSRRCPCIWSRACCKSSNSSPVRAFHSSVLPGRFASTRVAVSPNFEGGESSANQGKIADQDHQQEAQPIPITNREFDWEIRVSSRTLDRITRTYGRLFPVLLLADRSQPHSDWVPFPVPASQTGATSGHPQENVLWNHQFSETLQIDLSVG